MYYRLADDLAPDLQAVVASVSAMLDPAALTDLRSRLGTSSCA